MTKKNIIRLLFVFMLLGCTFTDSTARTKYWHQRVSLFDRLPVGESDIEFLGNSITDGGEFAELFDNKHCLNRGIVGDVVSGVKERLHQVTKGAPKKIFLLIGINDVSHKKSARQIYDEYVGLIEKIKSDSPSTKLYVESVLPIDNSFGVYKNLKGTEKVIPELNSLLKTYCEENNITYIDLWQEFANPKTGTLKKQFTNDGLHLTGQAYKTLAEILRPYVDE